MKNSGSIVFIENIINGLLLSVMKHIDDYYSCNELAVTGELHTVCTRHYNLPALVKVHIVCNVLYIVHFIYDKDTHV